MSITQWLIPFTRKVRNFTVLLNPQHWLILSSASCPLRQVAHHRSNPILHVPVKHTNVTCLPHFPFRYVVSMTSSFYLGLITYVKFKWDFSVVWKKKEILSNLFGFNLMLKVLTKRFLFFLNRVNTLNSRWDIIDSEPCKFLF